MVAKNGLGMRHNLATPSQEGQILVTMVDLGFPGRLTCKRALEQAQDKTFGAMFAPNIEMAQMTSSEAMVAARMVLEYLVSKVSAQNKIRTNTVVVKECSSNNHLLRLLVAGLRTF
ncbi:hypothetical protein C8R43DRAFT_944428 [Mycena crocata]|nr:hypothetical protein C8R43DRAFT_944428 [Mycena crocata]